MEITRETLQEDFEETGEDIHRVTDKFTDTVANRTEGMKAAMADHMKSEEAKAKRALNADTGRTRLMRTNTDNQFRT